MKHQVLFKILKNIERSMFALAIALSFIHPAAQATGCEGAFHSKIYRLMDSALRNHKLTLADVQAFADSGANPLSKKARVPGDFALNAAIDTAISSIDVKTEWPALRLELIELLARQNDKSVSRVDTRKSTAGHLTITEFKRVEKQLMPVSLPWVISDSGRSVLAIVELSHLVSLVDLNSGAIGESSVPPKQNHSRHAEPQVMAELETGLEDQQFLALQKISASGDMQLLGRVRIKPFLSDDVGLKITTREYGPNKFISVLRAAGVTQVYNIDLTKNEAREVTISPPFEGADFSKLSKYPDRAWSGWDAQIAVSSDGVPFLALKRLVWGDWLVFRIEDERLHFVMATPQDSSLQLHALKDGRVWAATASKTLASGVRQIWPAQGEALNYAPGRTYYNVTPVMSVVTTAAGRELIIQADLDRDEATVFEPQPDGKQALMLARIPMNDRMAYANARLVDLPDGTQVLSLVGRYSVKIVDLEGFNTILTVRSGNELIKSATWIYAADGTPFLTVVTGSAVIYKMWGSEPSTGATRD